jgi:hypothetical protein
MAAARKFRSGKNSDARQAPRKAKGAARPSPRSEKTAARRGRAKAATTRAAKKTSTKKFGWGGARPGAGRPRKPNSGVPHLRRPKFGKNEKLYVILRTAPSVPDLRSSKVASYIKSALEAIEPRYRMRVVDFLLLEHQLHLVVEAENARLLSRGLQGLGVRLARGINRVTNHRGTVLSDRYELRVLRSPQQVKQMMAIVQKTGVVPPRPPATRNQLS